MSATFKESIEQGAKEIMNCIREKKGCLIGRFGTVECEVAWQGGTRPSRVLERNAGVFPCTEISHMEWSKKYMESIAAADILATGWYEPTAAKEQSLLHAIGWKGKEVLLRSLEPYYVEAEKRWTNLLKGERVCVVSSFADSGFGQVQKGGECIWGESWESIWPPGIEWHFVKTGYAPCLAQGRATWADATGEQIESWKDAVDVCVKEVLKTEARIVLLGCGGLGMIMGKLLKEHGKICIVLGGATQVFLGIKGERWAQHSVISKLWRESWVWPSEEETPRGAESIEGACYWKRN